MKWSLLSFWYQFKVVYKAVKSLILAWQNIMRVRLFFLILPLTCPSPADSLGFLQHIHTCRDSLFSCYPPACSHHLEPMGVMCCDQLPGVGAHRSTEHSKLSPPPLTFWKTLGGLDFSWLMISRAAVFTDDTVLYRHTSLHRYDAGWLMEGLMWWENKNSSLFGAASNI